MVWTATSGPGSSFVNRMITSPDADIAEDQIVNTVQLTNSGSTYFFIVTAYNAAGTESPVSNQISVLAP